MDHNKAVKCQKKLQNSKVLICGLGGVGGYVLRTLAAMGINNIKIVDFDVVEESNISRQVLYDYNDLGKSKVEIAVKKIKLVNPDANIAPYNKMIKTENDLMDISRGVDLIIPTFIALEAVKFLSGYDTLATLNKVIDFHLGGEITFGTSSVNLNKSCKCIG